MPGESPARILISCDGAPGHAYSRDAWSWAQSTGMAYTPTVAHHGGKTTYASRQRPVSPYFAYTAPKNKDTLHNILL